jgi:hypothetical protein
MTILDKNDDTARHKHFLVANKRLVSDEFDDETVIIDVEKGIYYSLHGITVLIWRIFQVPRSVSLVLDEAAEAFAETDCLAIRQTMEGLIGHEILLVVEPTTDNPQRLNCFAAAAFAPPVFQVFSDLSELIAIDPVHEVEEAAGWPVRPAKFPSEA